ncbi:MAG: HlyC/CorC family transporter [Labilithrix sp.]|nr:HlyC/CorC family transporter [Labilithrix sp.]MCW5817189.1 HlyC/CorC family transporter [Labilithrix sp.]
MAALVVSVLCLALNAFFVAAEFAVVKVRLSELELLARHGDRRAARAAGVLEKLDRYLSVTQVGITIASLGLGWVAEPAIAAVADRAAVAVTGSALGRTGHLVVDVVGLGTLTFLHVLVGELVPKAIAIRHSVATTLATAPALRVANVVLWPILWVLDHAQRAVLRLIGVDPEMTEGSLSEEEIVGILTANAGRSPEAIDKRHTLERVLRFAVRPVRQIMVPRVDVFALSIDTTGAEAFAQLQKHEYSRIPLYDGTLDDIVGYLYAKEFLLDDGARSRPNLRGLERHTLFIPETRDGLDALRDLQRARTPMAFVVDEYGGTSGILTIEELVEEVFGEIRDELDAEHAKIVRRADNDWSVDPRVSIDDLRDAGVPLEHVGPMESVGKIVLDRLAHVPRVGDVAVLADGVVAEVVSIARRRIRRLRVRAAT